MNYVIFLYLSASILFTQDEYPLGDLNMDNQINVIDIVRMIDIILEISPEPSVHELWASDINSDSQINVLDVVVLVEFILGYIICPQFHEPCPANYSQCCLEITNHNFTFEIDTLFTNNSQTTIRDVFTLNNGNIWGVGALIINNETYGGAFWDGSVWTLKHFNYYLPGGGYYDIQPQGIWYFSNEEIWLANGMVYFYDGDSTHFLYEPEYWWLNGRGVGKIWAYDRDNIFFAGVGGLIVYYNGEEFIEMETNTEVRLIDIWGTDLNNIWAVGKSSSGYDTVVLHYDGTSWEIYYYFYWDWDTPISNSNLEGMFVSVWAYEDWVYLCGWGGVWYNQPNIDDEWDFSPVFNWEAKRIRGNHPNDIFITYDVRALWHYNGHDWFDLGLTDYGSTFSRGLFVNENNITASGATYELFYKAFILKGTRENE